VSFGRGYIVIRLRDSDEESEQMNFRLGEMDENKGTKVKGRITRITLNIHRNSQSLPRVSNAVLIIVGSQLASSFKFGL